MADKTYAELTQTTTLADADFMASYSGSGPLKAITWANVKAAISAFVSGLYLAKAQNLNDLADKSQARSNLGLGTAAVANVGQSTGNVAAGDDNRFASNAAAASAAQTTANSALSTANAAFPAANITYGTAAPGTLATGVIYLQYTP